MLLVVLITGACGNGVRPKPDETSSTKVALDFANAVAAGDGQAAHGLLSARLKPLLTPEKLMGDYAEMVSYGSGKPTTVAAMTTMDAWPDKQPGDAQWVYVAIANDTYSEAVTVVVAEEASRLVIRSVEWGRP
jgi:hypothetical protein